MKKKGALELSIGTIVIIVLALTLLIFGIVLVRTIMCGAIGLTGEVNNKIKGEIDKMFGASGGEVQCIGNGEAVAMIPGQMNYIYCGIKALIAAEYDIKVKEVRSLERSISNAEVERWFIEADWKGTVAPGDDDPKKVARVNIPENAPEIGIVVELDIKKDGSSLQTQSLDFVISRQGIIKAAIC